jgi:hypothetical protein
VATKAKSRQYPTACKVKAIKRVERGEGATRGMTTQEFALRAPSGRATKDPQNPADNIDVRDDRCVGPDLTLQFIGRITRKGADATIGEATVVTNIAGPEAEKKLGDLRRGSRLGQDHQAS